MARSGILPRTAWDGQQAAGPGVRSGVVWRPWLACRSSTASPLPPAASAYCSRDIASRASWSVVWGTTSCRTINCRRPRLRTLAGHRPGTRRMV